MLTHPQTALKEVRGPLERRKWLDLIQIGFNGTHYADVSDPRNISGA
ncbi:hypothetical protein ACLB1N_35265 [Escherichia coli]